MELILLILKLILMVVFGVFGLIVLALGVVLLVPIRYEVSGSVGDAYELRIKGKLTYLLSVVKVLFSYEEAQFDVKFFLFGFEKKTKQEETAEEDATVFQADTAKEDTVETTEEVEITLHEKANTSSTAEHVVVKEPVIEPVSKENAVETEEVVETPTREKEAGKRKKDKQKKDKQHNKIDFALIKQELTDEHNKSVLKKIWSELGYLLKHFGFRKIETDLIFSAGDPALTGQILGVLCMMPFLYRYQFQIVPDFEAEEAYVKGTFLVSGKVRAVHILITLLRLIFDKEVRLVVKKVLAFLEK